MASLTESASALAGSPALPPLGCNELNELTRKGSPALIRERMRAELIRIYGELGSRLVIGRAQRPGLDLLARHRDPMTIAHELTVTLRLPHSPGAVTAELVVHFNGYTRLSLLDPSSGTPLTALDAAERLSA